MELENLAAKDQSLVLGVRRAFIQLGHPARIKLIWIVLARISTAILDLIGLLFITAFSADAINAVNDLDKGRPRLVNLVIPDHYSPLTLLSIGVSLLALRSLLSLILSYIQAKLLHNECSRRIKQFAYMIPSGNRQSMENLSSQQVHFLATSGIRASVSGILGPTASIMSDGAVLVLLLTFLFASSLQASLVSISFLGISSFFLYQRVARRQYRIGQRLGLANIQSVSVLQECWFGIRELLTRGTLNNHLSKFVRTEEEISDQLTFQTLFLNIPRYTLEALVMLAFGLIAVIASMGSDSSESLVLITVFVATTARILPSLIPLQNAVSDLQTNLGLSSELRKLQQIIVNQSIEQEILQKHQPHCSEMVRSVSPVINLIDVSYRYPDSSTDVLSQVNLNLVGPRWIAIQGPSGSGKSTLFDLLIGIRMPTEGEVLIAGYTPFEFVRKFPGQCAYLPQRIATSNASIAENVALGTKLEEIDESLVNNLLTKVGLRGLLERDPRGVWLPLGELAQSISGGQLQRLGLARCLYTNPKILLLDESTSGLDAETRAEILSTIKQMSKEILVVSISHDSSIVSWADNVFSIANGQVNAVR